jgi:hypothetical protein
MGIWILSMGNLWLAYLHWMAAKASIRGQETSSVAYLLCHLPGWLTTYIHARSGEGQPSWKYTNDFSHSRDSSPKPKAPTAQESVPLPSTLITRIYFPRRTPPLSHHPTPPRLNHTVEQTNQDPKSRSLTTLITLWHAIGQWGCYLLRSHRLLARR